MLAGYHRDDSCGYRGVCLERLLFFEILKILCVLCLYVEFVEMKKKNLNKNVLRPL